MSNFKMKAKPEMPTRKAIKRMVYAGEFHILKELNDYFVNLGITSEQVALEEHGYYEDEVAFCYFKDETDAGFDFRMRQYEDLMDKYNKWYAEN